MKINELTELSGINQALCAHHSKSGPVKISPNFKAFGLAIEMLLDPYSNPIILYINTVNLM